MQSQKLCLNVILLEWLNPVLLKRAVKTSINSSHTNITITTLSMKTKGDFSLIYPFYGLFIVTCL